MAAGRIAVVGAGLAGLSAAVELKRMGFAVDLFERSRLLGGKATSFVIDGVEVDNGQHVFLGCCTEFIHFVRELGGTISAEPATLDAAALPLFLQARFEVLLLARGRPPARLRAVNLPAPLHLGPALLGYRHLRPRDRLSVAFGVLAARRPSRAGESFAGWLSRHRQPAATRRAFWEPFLVPSLNATPEEVDAAAARFVVTTAFLSAPGAARIGWSRLPLARLAEAAAARVDQVHLRTPVTGLELEATEDDAPALRGLTLASGERVACDGVVLAVPPAALTRLLDRPEDLGVDGLDAFRPAPIVDVHLWYDLPELGLGFAALLDSPVQWVFEKGPGYLCCSLSAAGEHLHRPAEELVALCHEELAAVLPVLAGHEPVRGSATRDRDATFVPYPGLKRPGPTTRCPEVTIAGAWTDTGWPATMESAVRSGRAAARALVEQLTAKGLAVDGRGIGPIGPVASGAPGA